MFWEKRPVFHLFTKCDIRLANDRLQLTFEGHGTSTGHLDVYFEDPELEAQMKEHVGSEAKIELVITPEK